MRRWISSLGLLALATALGAPRAEAADEPARSAEKLDPPGKKKAGLLYPAPAAAKTLAVFLHGMCAAPELECPVFERGTHDAWLLCPPGPVACGGAGSMWTGTGSKLSEQVSSFVDIALSKHAGAFDAERGVLIGYSMGATAALRIVAERPNAFPVLVIVNASVTPSAEMLRKAGVRRAAFVSGDADRSATKLARVAARLAKAGLDARYFALKKTGHFFDGHSAERLAEPLSWAVSGLRQ